MSNWLREGIPKDIDILDKKFEHQALDLGFWLSEDWKDEAISYCDNPTDLPYLITGSYLQNNLDAIDVVSVVIQYYGYRLRDFEAECLSKKGTDWDEKQELCSTAISIFIQLLKQLTTKDYDYVEEVADDISEFYENLVNGYLLAKQRPDANESKKVFLIGIRMLRDIMDHIYRTVGLPID